MSYLLMAILAGGFGIYHLISFLTKDYTPMKFRANPMQADVTSIAIGERVYQAHCLSCHGPMGLGNGPLARKLRRPPSAFMVSLATSHTDGDLFYWIQYGKAGTAMPAFTEYVSLEDTWHVINYLQRFRGDRAP
jgi:mono/diheme cytochrome c family protein